MATSAGQARVEVLVGLVGVWRKGEEDEGWGEGLALYPTSHRGKSNRGVRGSDLHFRKNPWLLWRRLPEGWGTTHEAVER